MKKTLVIGSKGKTGSRVFKKLQALKIPVVPASRSSEIPFDWYKASTWPRALKEIEQVYITFQPDLAVPQAEEILEAFINTARSAGVQKLVLLSGRGEAEARACEDLVISSGIDYTILRCSFFMQNFSEGIWLDAILTKDFVIPQVKAREPFVDADDIAEIAVKALLEGEYRNRVIELTGPELLSFRDIISKISEQTGEQIQYSELALDEYAVLLRRHQVPEETIWLISYLFGEVLDGRNESVDASVPLLLGRNASTFDDYVRKTIQSGIWSSNH